MKPRSFVEGIGGPNQKNVKPGVGAKAVAGLDQGTTDALSSETRRHSQFSHICGHFAVGERTQESDDFTLMALIVIPALCDELSGIRPFSGSAIHQVTPEFRKFSGAADRVGSHVQPCRPGQPPPVISPQPIRREAQYGMTSPAMGAGYLNSLPSRRPVALPTTRRVMRRTTAPGPLRTACTSPRNRASA